MCIIQKEGCQAKFLEEHHLWTRPLIGPNSQTMLWLEFCPTAWANKGPSSLIMSLQKFRMTSLFWSFHRFVPETTLGHRDTGTLGHQDTLTQGNFDTGTLWHRDTFGHRDSLTPGQFDTGTVWHRDTLTQGHFDTGALWHRDALTPEHFDLAKTILIWSTYELRFGIIEVYFRLWQFFCQQFLCRTLNKIPRVCLSDNLLLKILNCSHPITEQPPVHSFCVS